MYPDQSARSFLVHTPFPDSWRPLQYARGCHFDILACVVKRSLEREKTVCEVLTKCDRTTTFKAYNNSLFVDPKRVTYYKEVVDGPDH